MSLRTIRLVGELNPLSDHERFALWDEPVNCSGWRLRNHILGVAQEVYRSFARSNLCVGMWGAARARDRALEIMREPDLQDVVVLLGGKVTKSFGLKIEQLQSLVFADRRFVHLPHPSGLNRVWNDYENVVRARSLMEEVAPGYEWGRWAII